MSEIISTADALRLMRTQGVDGKPVAFDLQFVKADKRRRSAGPDVILIEGGILKSAGKRRTVADAHFEKLNELKKKRDPHHDENKTVNVYVPASDRTVKVHVRLITAINNKRVVY